MSDLAGTHDLKRIIFSVNGRRIRGGGENDYINIVFDENNYTKKYGSTGRVTRSKLNARGGKITLTLMQTDIEDIIFLDALEALESPFDVCTLVLQAAETLETYVAPQCWIEKSPDVAMNREAGNRVYVFDAAEIQKKTGI